MTIKFELMTGSDLTLSKDQLTIVRKARCRDVLPQTVGADYFDYVASQAIAWVETNYPMYDSPKGDLFWNNIQLHENFYAQHYDLDITYGPYDHKSGAYQISFDSTGGTVNTKEGTVIGAFGPNAPPLDEVSPLIGVQGDDVRGVDIPVEVLKINVMFRHSQGVLSRAYIKATGKLIGYPNEDIFLDYAPGEVMYKGGNATETSTEASASYSFDISFNKTNYKVAGITVASKYGWDILDAVHKDDPDSDKPRRIIDYLTTKRPAGREFTPYVNVFGWGG